MPSRHSSNPYLPRYWPYWLALTLLWVLHWLPYRWLLAIGKGLGRLLYGIIGSRRAVVQTNLQLCFPELTQQQRQTLGREHFEALGMGLMESALCWWGSEQRLAPLAEFRGLEHLDAAFEQGQGALLLSAHVTCLEMGGRLMVSQRPIDVMYRKNHNPVVERALQRNRAAHAGMAIRRDDAKLMIRRLRKNHAVWYAPDQSRQNRYSIVVPFMGEPAMTNTGTTRIAKISKAPVLPFYVQRKADGSGYLLEIGAPLAPFPGDSDEADAIAVNAVVEEQVRRAPAQYLWVHKKFKKRAPHPNPYS